MRTIVAFLFAVVVTAQNPASLRIQNLERRIAAKPDDADLHFQLLQALTVPDPGIPRPQVIEKRRLHILWEIQVHPEGRRFIPGSSVIPPRGPFGDPVGYKEAARLWREAIAEPGASTEVLANAAIYFKAFDRGFARELLNTAMREHPEDPALNRARGILDAATMVGVSGVGERGQFLTSDTLRKPDDAETARKEVETSKNPQLLGGAGLSLSTGLFDIPFGVTFGDDDASTVAERWLRRAVALDPSAAEWKELLARVLRTQAGRAETPGEKLRLFREAMSLSESRTQPTFLPDVAKAEFETGDDAGAERDARRMLDAAAGMMKQNSFGGADLLHRGNILLGRAALARGDQEEAKERLLASLRVPENAGNLRFNGPDLTLAQDLVDVGEREAVLQFLEQTRTFWKFDRGRIDHLENVVKKSRSPDLLTPFSPPVGGVAASLQLADADGKRWTLKELAGKPVALEFFRPECERCWSETFPELEKASKDFIAAGGVVLAIQIGVSKGTTKVPVPVLLDTDGSVARRYEVETSPELVLIGSDGNLAGNYPGFWPEGSIAQNLRQSLNRGSGTPMLDAPVQTGPPPGQTLSRGVKTDFSWEAVDNAESYVVEWDTRDAEGWLGERDSFFRVIPTREAATRLEIPDVRAIRWRVYAVPKTGAPGKPSGWQELMVKR